MVKKLRFKFILFSIISIFTLLLLILIALNITNFVLIGNEADRITENIIINNGRLRRENPQNNNPFPAGIDSPESEASTRFMTVDYDKTSGIYTVNLERNTTFSNQTDVIEMAKNLKNSEVGWYNNYRYRISENDTTIKYVLLDYGRELTPAYNTLFTSIAVLFAGTGVSFVVLFYISKIVVDPFIKNQHQQKRFISDASHELKTPITIISANNEIEELEKGQSDATKAIAHQVDRLTNLVKSLNTLVKYDEAPKTKFSVFDICSIANGIAEGFIASFEVKNKKLDLEISENPISCKGDESMIRELCSILLDNALKYSKSYAKFTLDKETNRIVIKCENDTDNEYPERYNGELNVVFDRFYRGDTERASNVTGSGIGLSIAKEIVNMHNGRIYANGKKNIFIIKVEI